MAPIVSENDLEKPNKVGLNWTIAAGIVGADIGTSIFYGTGILFPIVGYLAPVFVLTTCLMMWVFKRTYEEGLALSPYNGGAYSMILRTLGRRFAVLAGTLTFVSYLATAAVSALSGGFYLLSSWTDLSDSVRNNYAVLLSFIPIVIFSLLNTKGIREPAKIVTVVAGIHFFLLIILSFWGLGFLILNHEQIDFSKFDQLIPSGELTLPLIMYGFAAAFLGITGFESAAQIVEELEPPILKTVRRLYKTVIILVSVTAPVISILCLTILTRDQVDEHNKYLLSEFAFTLGGNTLRWVIVIDAVLTLFAAVNTAFVGFIGLSTTMAKQGNLPTVLIYRIAHKFPAIQGYPFIALSFAVVAMFMSAYVAGEIEVAAKVYEIAFLGVMVSFCLGVILMRNKPIRQNTPQKYLSHWTINSRRITIPLAPLFSGLVLGVATLTLLDHADDNVLLLLTVLFSGVLLLKVYFRWGVLENRLETRSDLRLGIGHFATMRDLPEDLQKYILCTGGTGARQLINQALRHILREEKGSFELVIFHAEDGRDPEGFFSELLQRVVSQQVAPIYNKDFILTVKILPETLMEGLQILKRTYDFKSILLGAGRDPKGAEALRGELTKELDINVIQLEGV